MLLNAGGESCAPAARPGKAIMNNRIRIFSTAAAMVLGLLLTSDGIADAQSRNDREVRDALRSLNSRIEDFENDLGYRMQTTSSPNGQVSGVMNNIRSLRDATRGFEDNLYQHRENRDDVNHILAAAKPIDAFLRANPQNRQVDDDWA